jgi:hypothetical protein
MQATLLPTLGARAQTTLAAFEGGRRLSPHNLGVGYMMWNTTNFGGEFPRA